jgi:hypothetical protein
VSNLILGFDILAAPDVVSRRYKQIQLKREHFFLRPEIQWPVSVDRATCPSVFQPTIISQPPSWSKDELNLLGFWMNVDHMLGWLKATPNAKELIRFPIALRITFEGSVASDPQWATIAQTGTWPKEIAKCWTHLGYDIADHDQTSALSGFEYQPEEMTPARNRWGNTLNEWGLLPDLESASAFRNFSNRRLHDQAPFYVYEIFTIPIVPHPLHSKG